MQDASAFSKRSNTVLVVDDSPDFLQVLKVGLEFHGYCVLSATDGRAALEVLARYCCDAVLTDHYLPEMTGKELIRASRALPSTALLPFILMSGEMDRTFTGGLAANAFLRKPFELSQLLRILRRVDCLPDSNAITPAMQRPRAELQDRASTPAFA